MLECDGIDISGRIGINKSGSLYECIICHYWLFFGSQKYVTVAVI